MQIRYSSICDIGENRDQNQDSIYTKCFDEWGIFIVADGMGGHSDGACASGLITKRFNEWTEKVSTTISQKSTADLFSELRLVISAINDEILADTEDGEICGSTIVLLLVRNDSYILLSVGDSRCYELRKKLFGGNIAQLTYDEISNEPGKRNGKLTNAVGVRSPLRCNIVSGQLLRKHIFFLCTDGVYKVCTDNEIYQLLRKRTNDAILSLGDEIKNLVYKKGAKDNLSAIVVSITQ